MKKLTKYVDSERMCGVCGRARPEEGKGSVGRGTTGTWWYVSAGVLTCSPACRMAGSLTPGPFDDDCPWAGG